MTDPLYHKLGIYLSLGLTVGMLAVGILADHFLRRSAMRKAQWLLDLSPKEIWEEGYMIIGPAPGIFNKHGYVTLFAAICFVSPLITLNWLEAGAKIMAFLPIILALFFVLRDYVRDMNSESRFLTTVTEEIVLKGRYAQIDAWLTTLPNLDWKTKGMNRMEFLFEWGSWQAINQLPHPQQREFYFMGRSKFPGFQKIVEENLGIKPPKEKREFDFTDLDGLSKEFTFWRRLMLFFPRPGGLSMLNEMQPDPYGLKDALLEQLMKQKLLLQSFPHVYCPECRTRGKVITLKHFRMVGCRCEEGKELLPKIKTVVGTIGDTPEKGVKGIRYYDSIWDEETRKPIPGEVDAILVAEDFAGDIDWAVSATVEALRNQNFLRSRQITVILPPGKALKRNTEMILKEKRIRTTTNMFQI